jgi:SAM-dependent methyltransferase
MNVENVTNADRILAYLQKNYVEMRKVKVLDICCGVYDDLGTNYDADGLIYEPLVAQSLAQAGFQVTGVDIRPNVGEKKIFYHHRTDVNILEPNWTQKLADEAFDVVIFLRSWDTPELILAFQKETRINDVNQLNLVMARRLFQDFVKLLSPGGFLIVSEVFWEDLFQSEEQKREILEGYQDVLHTLGLKEERLGQGLWRLGKI